MAYDVHARIECAGLSLADAADAVIRGKLEARLPGASGLIAIDRDGHVEMCFSTEGMYRGWSTSRAAGWSRSSRTTERPLSDPTAASLPLRKRHPRPPPGVPQRADQIEHRLTLGLRGEQQHVAGARPPEEVACGVHLVRVH